MRETLLDGRLAAAGATYTGPAVVPGEGSSTLTIHSGTSASNLSALASGTIFVNSGARVDGMTVTGEASGGSHGGTPAWGMAAAGLDYPGCGARHGGVISGLTASHYGAAIAASGGLITGGSAADFGTIAAGGGGVVEGATAGAGGLIAAGALGSGTGIMNGVHIGSGGAGVVGEGLSSQKNGHVFTLHGHGISSDAVVDAGGLLDVMSEGVASGGTIMGAAVVESGGLLSGALFSGAREGGQSGYNGWINAGGTGIGNTVAGGAVLGLNGGGTGIGNTALSGGLIEVGRGQAHTLQNNPEANSHSMAVGTSVYRGSSLSAVISGGGSQMVDGGVESGATIMSGGAQSIDQGGSGAGDIVSSGGTDVIGSGGALGGGIARGSGATIWAISGGSADGVTAMDRGLVSVGQGGSGGTLTAQGAGSVYVGSGGTAGAVYVNGGGTGSFAGDQANVRVVSVTGGGTALNPFLRSGQTLVVGSGGYVSGAVIGPGMDNGDARRKTITGAGDAGAWVSAGGTLSGASIGGGTGNGTAVEVMGGLLRVYSGATLKNVSMGYYGQIEVMDVRYDASGKDRVTFSDGILTLTDDGGNKLWQTSLAGDYNSGAWQVWDDEDSGNVVIVYDTCFLKGTLIDTPDGPRPVEKIQEGDLINALAEGKIIPVTVLSLRRGRGKADPGLPEDLAGWPVCIRKDAFGAGVPARDLRVTAEHCFFFEGRFIPVRMLVNGKSIYYDASLPEFAFYHLETGPHAVIFAEGALTESWLNTDVRRKAVPGANGVTRLEVSRARSWTEDAAAPLDVSAGFAEPLWKRLDSRADSLGLADRRTPLALDSDPDLRLLLADGRTLRPARRRGRLYLFDLPVRAQPQALLSGIFRPSESVGPWVDDRRQLGVLVGRISVFGPDGLPCEITAHLGRPDAPGWDVAENSPCRWTRGAAALPPLPDPEITRQPAAMVVEILAGGPYRIAASNASEVPPLRAAGQTGRG